jgi:succinate dehydrogenase / fumarate reductase cytochrome b subunit
MLQAVEVVLLGSILFHGIYGLFIVRDARANMTRYPRARNWMFFLQRVTGVIAFVFIGYHVYTTRLRVYFGMWGWQPDVEVTAEWMKHNIFGNGWIVTSLYVVGVVSSIFHLTNGIWNGLISWGVTVGPAAQKVSAYVCTIGGVLMSAFGVWVLFGFQNV